MIATHEVFEPDGDVTLRSRGFKGLLLTLSHCRVCYGHAMRKGEVYEDFFMGD